jgi:hypothetical protein
VVNLNGTIYSGTGFTVEHPSKGYYRILFNPYPSGKGYAHCTLSGRDGGGVTADRVNFTSGGIYVEFRDYVGSNFTMYDNGFSFICFFP